MKVGLLICIFLTGTCYGQWEYQSMHFPQTPKAGGWDIGPKNNAFRAADDFRCSKTGNVTNVIFWVSWQQDHVGTLDNFLITIYKSSIKAANLVWKGSANLEYYPDRSKFDFTMTRMVPQRQGWFDAVDFSPLFPNYGFWLDDHEKWEQIDAHNFQVPPRLEQGVTYWLKIDADEMGMFDPNYVDDGNDVFPTLGWKESDKHFGSSAKIWCDPCSGWKVMADPLTNGAIDFAFVIVTAPPPGDITKDGKINYQDVREMANSWLDINFRSRVIRELLGQWEFEDSNETSSIDSSSNENTVTIYNGAKRVEGAMFFDGSDDYLQTEESNKLQLWADYTLAAWMKADNVQSPQAGILVKTNLMQENQWSLQFGSQITNRAGKLVVSNGTSEWDSDIKLADIGGSWHHVAVVHRRNSMISFVDGQIKKYSDGFEDDPVFGEGHLTIGAETSGKFFYKGLLDDVRIYDYPLSPDEIKNIYQKMELPEKQSRRVCYQNPYCDLNGDCKVDAEDFTILAENWMKGY